MPRRALAYSYISIIIIILIIGLTSGFGQGTNSFHFLQMPVGSRAQAMGSAYTAISSDINGIYYNPAGLGFGFRPSIMLYHAKWFEDISIENLSFCYPNLNNFALFFGLSYLHLPEIEGYEISSTNTPIKTSPFKVYNLITQLGLSYKLTQDFSIGLQTKYLNERIDNISASGVAFDMGFLYKLPVDYLSIGASIQNLGPKIKYHQHKENLPLTYRIGLAYNIPFTMLTIAFDAIKTKGEEWKVAPGLEMVFVETFAIRTGYQFQQDIGSWYTMGFGITFMDNYDINYTFAPYGILGNTHRAEFVINFGNFKKNGKYTKAPSTKPYSAGPFKSNRNLPIPSGLKAQQDRNRIYLNWQPINIPGVSYNLYVKIPEKTRIIKITKRPINKTSLVFNPTVNNLRILVYVSTVVGNTESYLSRPLLVKYNR